MSVRFFAAGLVALLAWSGMPETAWADSPVTVTAYGPERIVATTYSATGRKVVTFDITDSSLTATGATICIRLGNGDRQGCRYQRFDGQAVDDDEYGSDDEYTRWNIIGVPGRWTIGYPVGFDAMSREQCIDTLDSPKGARYAAIIEVMNDAGTVLSTGSWAYEVTCTGLLGGATGPKRTRVFASRSTTSKPFEFSVLDTRHLLESYRICNYSSITGRYFGCDREQLTKRHRTDFGWYLNYSMTYPAMGSGACQYIGRQWPQSGIRIQFYDGSYDKRVTVFWGTRLDCG